MILKLAKKKEINEDVLRMIIQYGLGFASRVKNLENKEIEDWKEDKLYEKGGKVLYNNYLWVAKVTNQSSTWNESYWKKIGDDLELIDLDTIKTMLGLTSEEITTLQSILNDAEIRLDKTHSSSKIFSDMQDILSQSKAFTLQEFAKASKASYQVVSTTSEMTDKSVIYLMSNGSNYDMYIVESDGTPTKIGDTTIDLSQFYTKTEIDNDFVKKTDADGKYATITTVDGKVDKTSILSTISSTPSDDKLLSEKAINDTLVKKTDITTTINTSSTDSEVPSAKSVWDNDNYTEIYYTSSNTVDEILKGFRKVEQNKIKIIKIYDGTGKIFGVAGNYIGLLTAINGNEITCYFVNHWNPSIAYICRIENTDTKLKLSKVCTTSVADIPTTTITPTFPSSVKIGRMQFIKYSVKNGWANVSIIMHLDSASKTDWFPIANNLPKPDKEINFSTIGESTANIAPIAFRLEKLDEGRTLEMMVGAEFTVPNWYNVNFSYPVAEQ